jgi:hypothetical protein
MTGIMWESPAIAKLPTTILPTNEYMDTNLDLKYVAKPKACDARRLRAKVLSLDESSLPVQE